MPERLYTDEEVAAIFEAAAESRVALPIPQGVGMTLATIQEIGHEVGYSAEAIEAAAQRLDRAGHPVGQTLMGFPIGVGRIVEVARPMTDDEWDHLVADLRGTFNARGTVLVEGKTRHWVNGNLQATVEPTANGHRLRIRTTRGNSRALMTIGLVALGTSVATAIALAIGGTLGASGPLSGVSLLALLGVGAFGLGAMQLPSWARRRSGQMEGILSRHVDLP